MSPAFSRLQRLRQLTFSRTAIVIILVCTLGGAVLGYLKARRMPFIWTITSRVLLQVSRESGSARPEIVAVGGSAYVTPMPRPEDVSTEIALLKSAELMRRAFERMTAEDAAAEAAGATPSGGGGGITSVLSKAFRDAMAALDLTYKSTPESTRLHAFTGQFQFQPVPKSTMIDISCVTANPERGKQQLELLIKEYIDFHISVYSPGETSKLFEKERDIVEAQVREAQDKLRQFRIDTDMFDIDAKRDHVFRERLSSQSKLWDLQEREGSTSARLEDIARQLVKYPEMSIVSKQTTRNQTRESLERLALQVDQDLIEAEVKYQPDNHELSRIRTKRDRFKALLDEMEGKEESGETMGRDPIHTHLEQQQVEAETNLHAIASERRVLNERLVDLSKSLTDIEAKRAVYEQMYMEVTERKEDLRRVLHSVRIGKMQDKLDEASVTNVRIVSPPTIPPGPNMRFGFSPRVFAVLMSAAMGFCLSLGFFLLRAALREGSLMAKQADADAAESQAQATPPPA